MQQKLSSTFFPFGPPVYVNFMDEKYIEEMLSAMKVVEKDPDAYSMRHRLAGQIEEQYEIFNHVSEACIGHIMQHVNQYSFDFGVPPFEDGEAKIDSLWVNKQIAGEVNPPHSHDGLMSFVIYLDNPLDREECINNRFDNARKTESAGHLTLRYGEMINLNWNVYSLITETGHIIIFPAWLQHFVHPHYEEGKTRISVAGNVQLI